MGQLLLTMLLVDRDTFWFAASGEEVLVDCETVSLWSNSKVVSSPPPLAKRILWATLR